MNRWLWLAFWIVLSLLPGAFGSLFPPDDWYAALAKPAWNPPSWVFGPVWTALYIMMGVAAWLIWDRHRTAARVALALFVLQLVANAAWSWLFFGLRSPALAFADRPRDRRRAAATNLPADHAVVLPRRDGSAGTYLNPEPDRWRGDGFPRAERGEALRPLHRFRDHPEPSILLDAVGPVPLPDGAAGGRHDANPAREAGLLPFRIVELYQSLVVEWRLWRREQDPVRRAFIEQRIINDAGILGHYVTDGANPHHTSVHHDGWRVDFPNPAASRRSRGFHSRFESRSSRRTSRWTTCCRTSTKHRAGCRIVRADVLAYLRSSHDRLERLYELDLIEAFRRPRRATPSTGSSPWNGSRPARTCCATCGGARGSRAKQTPRSTAMSESRRSTAHAARVPDDAERACECRAARARRPRCARVRSAHGGTGAGPGRRHAAERRRGPGFAAGMVVSANVIASQVGMDVLRAGGNAVDAAIATGFALAVVHPTAGNIGGGGFMVIRFPDGRATAIDFREKAPLRRTRRCSSIRRRASTRRHCITTATSRSACPARWQASTTRTGSTARATGPASSSRRWRSRATASP
jgi:hypothetical protein